MELNEKQIQNDEYINVGVRFRPLNKREHLQNGGREVFTWSNNVITPLFPVTRSERSRQTRNARLNSPRKNQNSTNEPVDFVYDHVFTPTDTTRHIYDKMVHDLVLSAMNGVHSATFAFGQTSTGKTFTMQGTGENPGIIPLSIDEVFQYVYDNPDREFLLRVSYLEVYNESVNDLLNPSSSNLKIYEDKKRGPCVKGLEEKVVVTPEQIFALIAAGESQRHIGCTDFNEQSSRSHTIFRLVIESKRFQEQPDDEANVEDNMIPKPSVQVATLNLVDLAGSESAQSTKTKQHKQEGACINKSLLTLTHVIFKLSELATQSSKLQTTHIPYRDSKLTRILQPALQGNSRISIICTATPWGGVKEETLNTLRFATRAKRVKRIAKVNQIVDERAMLIQYKQEIADLRKQLAEAKVHSQKILTHVPLREDDNTALAADDQLREQIDQAIKNLNRVILNSSLTASERKKTKMQKTRRRSMDFQEFSFSEMAECGQEEDDPFFNRLRKPSATTNLLNEFEEVADEPSTYANGEVGFTPPEEPSLGKMDLRKTHSVKIQKHAITDSDVAEKGGSMRRLSRSLSYDGSTLTVDPEFEFTRQLRHTAALQMGDGSMKHQTHVASELQSIRSHLQELLQGVSQEKQNAALLNGKGIMKLDGGTVVQSIKDMNESTVLKNTNEPKSAGINREQLGDKEYILSLEQTVSELQKQIEQNRVETHISNTDRTFLEDLLNEKEKTIKEWGVVIKDIEDRQRALESENQLLKEENRKLQRNAIGRPPVSKIRNSIVKPKTTNVTTKENVNRFGFVFKKNET